MTLTNFAIVVLFVTVAYLWRDVRALNKRVQDKLAKLREHPPVVIEDPRDAAAAVVDRHVQEHHRR